MSASKTTALATAAAAYRPGAVTVTTLMTLPATCAPVMLVDLLRAAWSAARGGRCGKRLAAHLAL